MVIVNNNVNASRPGGQSNSTNYKVCRDFERKDSIGKHGFKLGYRIPALRKCLRNHVVLRHPQRGEVSCPRLHLFPYYLTSKFLGQDWLRLGSWVFALGTRKLSRSSAPSLPLLVPTYPVPPSGKPAEVLGQVALSTPQVESLSSLSSHSQVHLSSPHFSHSGSGVGQTSPGSGKGQKKGSGIDLQRPWTAVEMLQGGCVPISGVLGPQLRRGQGGRCSGPSLGLPFLKRSAQIEVTPWSSGFQPPAVQALCSERGSGHRGC